MLDLRLLIITIFLVCAQQCAAAEPAAKRDARLLKNLKQHVYTLADDKMQGREAGGRGNQAAGQYIINALKTHQLLPAGKNGQFTQLFHGRYQNILAIIPGTDPVLKNEFLVIGAHYDHVGFGSRDNSRGPIGKIHNGADDNASGTAALLGLAELFQQDKLKLKRSVLLAFWDAEEKGLLGSSYWVQQPTVSLGQVVLYFNLDMVGRLRQQRIHVFGSRTHLQARRVLSQSNLAQFHFDFDWNVARDSDHYAFFTKGIPFLMLTTDRHQDYHRPSDDAEKLNYQGLSAITRLVARYASHVGNAKQPPEFRKQCRTESEIDHKKQIAAEADRPSRLGIRWDHHQEEQGKIVIANVDTRSPAEVAGLKTGDRIKWLKQSGADESVTVKNSRQFRWLINRAENPIELGIIRSNSDRVNRTENNNQPAEIVKQVRLNDDPRKVGISWRTDSADPQCVIISRVVPDTPADWAGLKVGDRIYELDYRSFERADQFGEWIKRRVASAAAKIDMLVERNGIIELKSISFRLK